MNKRTPPRTPKSSGNSDKSGRWAPSTSGPSRSERRPDQKPRGNDGKPNNPYNKRSSSRTDTRADKQMDTSSSQRQNAPSGQRRGYKGAVKADEPRTSRPSRPPVITERTPTTPEPNRAKKSSRGRKHSRGRYPPPLRHPRGRSRPRQPKSSGRASMGHGKDREVGSEKRSK
jgi:hypothetical protein